MTATAPPPSNHLLRRLFPVLKPILPRLIFGLISALAASIVALLIPQVYQTLINSALSPGGERTRVWFAAGLVLLLGVLEATFIALRRFLVVGPATTVETSMRTSFYRQLQQLSLAFHDRWGSGQLLSRSMTDLNLFRRWLAFGAIMLVVTTFTVILGTVLLFTLSWVLALIFVMVAIPLIINGFRFSRYYRQISRRSQDQAGDLATAVEESVHGIRILKAFGRSREALASFSEQAEQLRGTEIRKAKSLAVFSLVVTLLPELALGTGLILGVLLVAAGELSIGGLVAFFATAAIMTGPVESIGPLLAMTLSSRTALERYFEVMDTSPEITDPAQPREPAAPHGELVLDQLRFRYPGADAEVLAGVDLTIRPGETMALVGVTGSGKSTLLHLIPRLYEASGGSIRIDGVDIRDLLLEALRTMVSIAFEDTILFSATVRENVLLGLSPELAQQEAEAILTEALDVAQADFAYTLPEGLNTTIGEQGLSLSGGQRQRLALARAIAAKPAILVLDDPLSALDVATEERVEARLREVLAGTTTLIVAHRPSTVALADRVALLQDGRVSAVGTHAELMAGNAHYRHVLADLGNGQDAEQEQTVAQSTESEGVAP
ncbi:ABC transporter ATP-binding protein/permease [Acaricomes phytoseiuli]|uniref:ABC transporter ATP-binding protein n=1 Tax=Acaricomes phytoseiuli TaxID=291968 RepID=UPI002222E938|nr:ABC transporter ATP-binding protein [Acaricomes phytoseiuli]MCW1249667.1 ABC transporter ATP-binding protein/permease [Acaricomes phytoseiuli]